MNTYKKNVIGILLLFLMISCALESKFALPNDEKIKSELIGEWSNEKSNNESFRIEKNDEKTYKLVSVENNKQEELIAFSKTINGINIMNVITEYEGIVTNVFYGFTVDGNTLTYSEVNNKLKQDEFKSEAELLIFFQENVNKKDFFTNPVELRRK